MKNVINIGASSYTGNYLLPRILPDWERMNPDTEVKLEITDTEDVFLQVDEGFIELGLVGACLESETVETHELLQDDQLILIVPPNHPFAQKKEISIESLRGQDFVLREPGSATRMWYREMFNRFHISFDDLNAVAELDSHPAVISAVEAGSGIALVPKNAAADSLQLGRLAEVNIKELSPMTGSLYMIWPRANSLSAPTREFIDYLKNERERLFAA